MDATVVMTGFVALYIFMLAAFTGYEIIGRVPAILHTPLMSGSNFIHGVVVVGAMQAAAPPPMPLYSATSCGIAVIGTRLPAHQAQALPMTSAAMIRPRLVLNCGLSGSANASDTSTATTMPTPEIGRAHV